MWNVKNKNCQIEIKGSVIKLLGQICPIIMVYVQDVQGVKGNSKSIENDSLLINK